MQWRGYPEPDVPNCFLVDEPIYNYHNLIDTKTKPNCSTWRRYTKKPDGKIFRRQGLLEKTKHNSRKSLLYLNQKKN